MKKFIFEIFFFSSFLINIYGMPNPSAVYCYKMGFDTFIEKSPDGGEYGSIILPNGEKVEEWAFYDGLVGQEYTYCAIRGYNIVNEDFSDKYNNHLNCAFCCLQDSLNRIIFKIQMDSLMNLYGDTLIKDCGRPLPRKNKNNTYDYPTGSFPANTGKAGCNSERFSFNDEVNLNSSTYKLSENIIITFHPKPTSGIYQLECSDIHHLVKIQITNIRGETKFDDYLNFPAKIDFSNEASGIYTIKIQDSDNTLIVRVVKI